MLERKGGTRDARLGNGIVMSRDGGWHRERSALDESEAKGWAEARSEVREGSALWQEPNQSQTRPRPPPTTQRPIHTPPASPALCSTQAPVTATRSKYLLFPCGYATSRAYIVYRCFYLRHHCTHPGLLTWLLQPSGPSLVSVAAQPEPRRAHCTSPTTQTFPSCLPCPHARSYPVQTPTVP